MGGTIRWMAPEMMYPGMFDFDSRCGKQLPSRSTDIYALGMTILEVSRSGRVLHSRESTGYQSEYTRENDPDSVFFFLNQHFYTATIQTRSDHQPHGPASMRFLCAFLDAIYGDTPPISFHA